MINWMPSLNSLRALEAVARHQSYQKAAEELKVTPAAVKQLVNKLEKGVGRSLVKRRGRGIALTDTALLATTDLGLAMRHLADAVQKMRTMQTRDRLIVSVEASLANTWLGTRLETFHAQHPNMNVLIESSQRIVDLTRSDVDVAIRYGVPRDPNLITYRLFDDVVFPVSSPALRDKFWAKSDAEKLLEAPLIHWDMSHLPWAKETRKWFDWEEWTKGSGLNDVDASRGLRFSDYGLAVQAAISGQGVILASLPILQDPIDAGLLVPFYPDSSKTTGIGYDLVMTQRSSTLPQVRLFSDWLRRLAGADTV